MSYGLYDYDRRYRRRFWSRLAKFLVAVMVLAALAAFSYQLGVEQLKSRELSLQAELDALTAANRQAEQRIAQLQQMAQTAQVRVNELEVLYQRNVPSGDLAKLMELAARRLAEGVDPGRLAFVLEQTANVRSCTPRETKRFVLPTPLYKGANTSVAFADGVITVTGEGEAYRNAEGNREAWFDPTQPVVLRFVQTGGETLETKGVLPLQKSVIVGDREFRFTISPGARSFVEVSGDHCRFP